MNPRFTLKDIFLILAFFCSGQITAEVYYHSEPVVGPYPVTDPPSNVQVPSPIPVGIGNPYAGPGIYTQMPVYVSPSAWQPLGMSPSIHRPVLQIFEDNCWAATTQAITGISQNYLTDRIKGFSLDKALHNSEIPQLQQTLAEHGFRMGYQLSQPTRRDMVERLNAGNMLIANIQGGGMLHSVAVEDAGRGLLGIRRFVTVTDPMDGSRQTMPALRFKRLYEPADMFWIRPSNIRCR